MTDWHVRLDRLSESLLEAGVDWNPWIWNPVIRVRRGTRLAPELVAEMKSCLDMLRAIVARTTTVKELREFIRKCEVNARDPMPGPGAGYRLRERWRALGERTSRTGEVYLEEADELTMEELGELAFRIEEVEPGDWPPGGPSLVGMSRTQPDRRYQVSEVAPEPRPAEALRSLGLLVRVCGDMKR